MRASRSFFSSSNLIFASIVVPVLSAVPAVIVASTISWANEVALLSKVVAESDGSRAR